MSEITKISNKVPEQQTRENQTDFKNGRADMSQLIMLDCALKQRDD